MWVMSKGSGDTNSHNFTTATAKFISLQWLREIKVKAAAELGGCKVPGLLQFEELAGGCCSHGPYRGIH